MADRLQGPLGPERRLRAARKMVGLQGWNGSTRYEQTNAGPAGSAAMSRIVAFLVNAVPNSNQSPTLRGQEPIGARGWAIDITSAAVLRFIVTSGVPAAVVAPTYTIVGGDQARVIIFGGSFDGATARAYIRTAGTMAQIGAGTAGVGYTPPDASDDFRIGNGEALARPCDDIAICCEAGSDTTVWSGAQFQTISDDIVANFRIATATPGELFRYNADRADPPAGVWVADAGSNLSPLGATLANVVKVRFSPTFR